MVGINNPPESGNVAVVPDAGATIGYAPMAQHAGCLHECKSHARHREVSVMGRVPVSHMSVIGLVLAHRRQDDAVLERNSTQCQRGKQRRIAQTYLRVLQHSGMKLPGCRS